MKLRVTFDYEIPENLEPLFKNSDLIETAQTLFIDGLRKNFAFDGEFNLEQVEVIE